MSKFITVGNTSLIKADITKYIKEDYVGTAKIPFCIKISASDGKSLNIYFKTKEERDKAFEKFVKELNEN